MTNIKKTLAAGALAVIMTAGSAGAWPAIGIKSVTDNYAGAIVKFSSVESAAWWTIGGSFAAWTVYRFFQGCGPFKCIKG